MVLSREDRAARRGRIARDVDKGMTMKALERKYGVTERTIRNACEEAAVLPPLKHASCGSVLAVYASLIRAEKSATLETVAEEIGVSRSRVHQILDEARALDLIREFPPKG